MRISDGSSDVCSSDLFRHPPFRHFRESGNDKGARAALQPGFHIVERRFAILKFNYRCPSADPNDESEAADARLFRHPRRGREAVRAVSRSLLAGEGQGAGLRSEEHTSELQSLMRNSYAVFCLYKQKRPN